MHHGQWRRPDTRPLEYNRLEPWVELAQLLERGRFDALFLADVVGTYDVYRGSRDTAVAEGLQFPVNDPSLLIPAMAYATEHLGFAYTSSVLQLHPFLFARQVATLDHLTNGRIGWNIVTSYLENAARNLGFPGLPTHEERYGRAAEYVDVAGVQLAARECVRRLLRLLPVAGHHLGAAQHQLARLAGGQLAPLVVDDPPHRVEDRHAYRQRARHRVDRGAPARLGYRQAARCGGPGYPPRCCANTSTVRSHASRAEGSW